MNGNGTILAKNLNDTPNENDELSTLLMKILMDIRKSEDNDT